MKNYLIISGFVLLVAWNTWLTFNQDPNVSVPTIDYELLDSIYAKKELEISKHDTVFNQIGVSIARDSMLIHSADRHMRDSIRNLINPR